MGRRTQNNSRSHWYLAWSSAAITNNHNESQWPVRTNPCFEFTFFFKLNLIWIVYYLINIFKFKLRIAIWLKRKSVAGQLAQHSLLSVRSNGMAPRARSVRAKVSSSSWYLDFIMSDLQVDFVCFTWWSNTKSLQHKILVFFHRSLYPGRAYVSGDSGGRVSNRAWIWQVLAAWEGGVCAPWEQARLDIIIIAQSSVSVSIRYMYCLAIVQWDSQKLNIYMPSPSGS